MKPPKKIDPFGLLTESMERFQSGETDFYVNRDGFRLTFDGTRLTATRVTVSCLACNANKSWPWSDVQTPDAELFAVEGAHWQMNHRTKCKIPLGAVKIK